MSCSPPENELKDELRSLRNSNPTMGVPKLLHQIRERHPTWALSEKRLRKLLQLEGLVTDTSLVNGSGSKVTPIAVKRVYPYPVSKLNKAIDPAQWTNKVEIRQFDKVRGKGLVAKEKIQDREIIWKEDPWVLAADWKVYSGQQMSVGECCFHCSCPLVLRRSSTTAAATAPQTIECNYCKIKFCNRLCHKRAQETHHPLLCSGQSPASKPFLEYLKDHNWSMPHTLARATARILLLNARNTNSVGSKHSRRGSVGKVNEESVEDAWSNFSSLAGWTGEDKSRSQGLTVTNDDVKQWKLLHELYLRAFQYTPESPSESTSSHATDTESASPTDPISDSKTPSQGATKIDTPEVAPILQRHQRKRDGILRRPLPDEIAKQLFDFDSFMLNLGRVDLNRESYGGLYLLHSHINHCCAPNVTIRHVDQHHPAYAPGRITIIACKDIEPGEEIVASYVLPTMPVRDRKRELRQWGIGNCKCVRCIAEMEEETKRGHEGGQKGTNRDEENKVNVVNAQDLEDDLRRTLNL